jgi:hypothetical protein
MSLSYFSVQWMGSGPIGCKRENAQLPVGRMQLPSSPGNVLAKQVQASVVQG